ncbi:MAG: hypothetical protein CL670_15010 [Balneola sp.]|jgi:inhibitor of KinA|nr:hypothetical protein [Balneola sp.]MBE80467.1 hypothetical protein [Balneola sp.]HBX67045.1 hypothetical protein [Balneolaceae bacterium]|tara:strand:- start:3055 stop:3753 length:699 start_codon:yes stop_codon:yes gene_type:complete
MSKSLHLNGGIWTVSELGEQALSLKSDRSDVQIESIHQAVNILEEASINGVVDIIPSLESIVLVYDRLLGEINKELQTIEKACADISANLNSPQIHEIPVCYELGLDWDEVEGHTSLNRKEIIELHTSGSYTVAMQGFIPGFLYLSGLSENIACPRRAEPRTKIPAGSVGIGGNQTGIYSLESPGGWQIIGQTPLSFFDALQDPPTQVRAGDKVKFNKISEEEFQNLKGYSS